MVAGLGGVLEGWVRGKEAPGVRSALLFSCPIRLFRYTVVS